MTLWEALKKLISENSLLDTAEEMAFKSSLKSILKLIKDDKRDSLRGQLFICIDRSLQRLCEDYNCEYNLELEKKFLEEILRKKDVLSQDVWVTILKETLYINVTDQVVNDWMNVIKRTIAEDGLEKVRDYMLMNNVLKDGKLVAYPRILTTKPALPPEEYINRSECQEILEMLQQTKKLVLVNGIGGIGKSTVCRKIFHELDKDKKRALAWIVYNDKDLLSDLSQQLFYPQKGKEWEKKFIQFLQQDIEEDAVIFVDNLNRTEEEESFLEILANANCNVVCTSRIEKFRNYEVVPIDYMEEESCIQLFYEYYKLERDDEKIARIVNRAGRHTLVIEILGKIGNAENYSLDRLEEELEQKGFDLEGIASVERKEDTLIGHLCTTFDTSKLSERHRDILYCLAILPNQWIPLRFKDWLGLSNSYNINYLVKHAWFVKTKAGFYMHPVIKEVVKRLVPVSGDVLYCLLAGLEKELRYKESANYEESMLLCSFAEAVLNSVIRKEEVIVAKIKYSLSVIYGHFGDYDRAEKYVEECIEISKGMYGQELLLADAYNHSGYVHYYLFADAEAEKSYKAAYEIRKKLMNKKMIAETASNLALLYQGMWQVKEEKEGNEARKLLELSNRYQKEAIKMFEKIFKGKMHSNMASAYNNMAVLKYSQKEYEQAVFYYKKAEKIRLSLQDISMSDLSVTYLGLCDSYMDRAVTIDKDIYKLHNYKMALFYLRKGIEIRIKEIREGNQKLGVEDMEKKESMLERYIKEIGFVTQTDT